MDLRRAAIKKTWKQCARRVPPKSGENFRRETEVEGAAPAIISRRTAAAAAVAKVYNSAVGRSRKTLIPLYPKIYLKSFFIGSG